MSGHTPGPWEGHARAILANHGGLSKPLVAYCDDHRNRKPRPNKEHEANAHLIAAAPTAPHECDNPECPGNVNRRKLEAFDALLEVARGYVAHWACEPPENSHAEHLLKKARAAIAKAQS